MKKIVAILSSAVYLILTLGLAINLHYCQGELESVSVIGTSSNCCCAIATHESSCCNNEKYFFQFSNDNQLTASNIILSHPYQYFETAYIIEFKGFKDTLQSFKVPYDDSGPPGPTKAIWKTNCSLLFYG